MCYTHTHTWGNASLLPLIGVFPTRALPILRHTHTPDSHLPLPLINVQFQNEDIIKNSPCSDSTLMTMYILFLVA